MTQVSGSTADPFEEAQITMLIGELAGRTGVSRRSLRHYEKHGLLRARRDDNGWRDYDESAVERVRAIADMLGGGLTIEGITELAGCLDSHDPTQCTGHQLTKRVYGERLARLDERLRELQRSRDHLLERMDALGLTG